MGGGDRWGWVLLFKGTLVFRFLLLTLVLRLKKLASSTLNNFVRFEMDPIDPVGTNTLYLDIEIRFPAFLPNIAIEAELDLFI